MAHTLTLQSQESVTHDTHRYVFDRPKGFDFEPGQAAELAICREGWKDEGRPFTFTSLPADSHLEFTIKSYPSHDGVTEKLPDLAPGEHVTLDGPFGAITDEGPGLFLAAGAGVTPFIAILRKRAKEGDLDGCQLIFSNSKEKDIILRDEWQGMDGLKVDHVLSDEDVSGLHHGKVDKAFLEAHANLSGQVYICGPQGYVDAMRDAVKELGVPGDRIHTEEGW
ncbi:flavodoxin reductase [Roseovarius atlanticus]|uniref:Flavodoxin reductase n=1 Tax=Roseovarius atlanticus TaxID=1641875 RepID=A0A0T5NV32_9RHOB|nr:FAD-binding oxidoreductase [Roseovarius atlanticus]KRS12582.1 flavodoxin reductase [Roseovarius atlanticus]